MDKKIYTMIIVFAVVILTVIIVVVNAVTTPKYTPPKERSTELAFKDGVVVEGYEVVELIKDFEGEPLIICVVTGSGHTAIYNYNGTEKVATYLEQDALSLDYINPSGLFNETVRRDGEKVVSVSFIQK